MDQEELQVHRGARPGHFGQAFSKKEILYIVIWYTRALTFENLWQAGFTRIWQKLKPGREETAARQLADCECRRMQVCVCRERERRIEKEREKHTHSHIHTAGVDSSQNVLCIVALYGKWYWGTDFWEFVFFSFRSGQQRHIQLLAQRLGSGRRATH